MFPSNEEFFASRCGGCGLLYQNPRIRPERLPAHYPEHYGPYAVSDISLYPETLSYLKYYKGYHHLEVASSGVQPSSVYGWAKQKLGNSLGSLSKLRGHWGNNSLLVPRFVPNGRLLEVGCASGNRLALMRKLGWGTCLGIEYSETAAAAASQRGFQVITGPVETAIAAIPDVSLDVIISRFVVEHLENPFSVIRQFAAKLRPGGQFLFATINIQSPDFWLYGPHWYHLDLPRHMIFFRKRDVKAMLESNFRIERIRYEWTNYDYERCAQYRLSDNAKGWKRLMDVAVKRTNSRASKVRLWESLAMLGVGSRIFIESRKK
jgi:2-polyprenyl-3-methyl-5-hydroxy-6-metoxy-1,4-benzoquinol methylase